MNKFLGLALVAALLQDPEESRVHALIENLRSDRIELREEAIRALKRLGPVAHSQLEKAARDPDPEVSVRAKHLLGTILLMSRLTPALMKTFPGIEDRLTEAPQEAWTQAFLRATESKNKIRRYPNLAGQDVEALAVPALHGAATEKEKAAVCTSIGDFAIRGAIPELRTLLKRPEQLESHFSELGTEIIKALQKMGAREATPELLGLLKNAPGSTLEGEALKALGGLGAREARFQVAHLLASPGQYTREWAARVLRDLRARDMIPRLIPLLKDPQLNVRMQAADLLGWLGALEALPKLLELLKDPELRGSAAEAVGMLGTPQAIADLQQMLRDETSFSRSQVVSALSHLGARESIPEFIKLLENEDENIRESAVIALGTMGAREAIPALVHTLRDPATRVRWWSARALGDLGQKAGLLELLNQLKDEDAEVRGSAIFAMGRMGRMEDGSYFLHDLELHRDRSGEVRSELAWAIANLAAQEELPTLLLLLKDDDPNVRVSALGALGTFALPTPPRELSALLEDPERKVRAQVIATLTPLGISVDPAAMERRLTDEDYQVRSAAAQWLCEHGVRSAAATLLKDSSDLQALNALRSPKTWDRLRVRSVGKEREGKVRVILEELALVSNLKMDFSRLSPAEMESFFLRHKWVPPMRSPTDLKAQFMDILPDFYQLVVEEDRLLVLKDEAAFEFWNAWLEKK